MALVSTDVQGLYLQQLHQLLAAEKKYLNAFKKLATAADTAELKSALASASTEVRQQIERISQCLDLLKSKAIPGINGIDQHLLDTVGQFKATGKPSVFRDIELLLLSQQIFMNKVIAYQNLTLMAGIVQQDHAARLLEQCAKDNQNNYSYLVQISGNIIYPEAIKN